MQSRNRQCNDDVRKIMTAMVKGLHKSGFSLLMLLAMLFVTACNSNRLQSSDVAPVAEATLDADMATEVPTPQEEVADTPTSESAAPDTTASESVPTEPAPTEPPPPEPTATEPPPAAETPAALFYNMPPARLTSATGLYASPNRAEFIVPVTIPQGETIYVMGRNATSSHLRTVWNTGVGWVPVSFTDYNGQREKLADLPIFEQEPPACAIPVTTQFGFSSEWTSDQRQRIAVVADLFRSKYGPFPNSTLSLKVNGIEVESSRRPIVENGQFSLKDVVFSPGQDLQAGETVGYQLNTASDEPLTFMATIFSIPQNCQWEID